MKFVRKLSVTILLAVLAGPAAGCGVGTTAEQNARQVRRIAEYDARMLVDDVSLLIQTNRPVRTSRGVID